MSVPNFKIHGLPEEARRSWTVEPRLILANDVTLPGEEGAGLWVIEDDGDVAAVVWAADEEGALAVACGEGDHMLAHRTVDGPGEGVRRMKGNGSAFHVDLAGIQVHAVELVPERDWRLLLAFAEARGADMWSVGSLWAFA